MILYALTLGTASLLETVMFARAQQQGLFRHTLPRDVYRYGVIASLVPVVAFVVSIPIAFVNPTLALLSWLIVWPAEWIADKTIKPPETDELLP